MIRGINLIVALNIVLSGFSRAETNPNIQMLNSIPANQVSYALNGPWEFYWNRFVGPFDLEEPDLILQELKPWEQLKIRGEKISAYGYASYIMRFDEFSMNNKALEILINFAEAKYRVSFYRSRDKKLIFDRDVGRVQNTEPLLVRKSTSFDFYPEEGESYDLVIWVRNEVFRKGAIFSPPTIYIYDGNPNHLQLEGVLSAVAAGTMIAMGLYNFMVWWRRKTNFLPFYVSMGSFAIGVRGICATQWIRSFIPDNLHSIVFRLEYLSMPSIAFYTAFLAVLLNVSFNKYAKNIYIYFSIALSIFTFVLPISYLSSTLPWFQGLLLTSYLVQIYILVRGVVSKKKYAVVNSIAYFLVATAGVHDLYFNKMNEFDRINLTPFGVSCMLILQSLLLADKFSEAFKKVEQYAANIAENEKARTLFFHNTSHELRTPLNGISGYLELALKGEYGKIPARVQEQLVKTLKLADALKIQVNTILDLAKSKKGELKLLKQRVGIHDLLDQAEILAEGLCIKGENLSFKTDLQNPKGVEFIIGDFEAYLTIIRNLLGNAFKFTAQSRNNQVKLTLALTDHFTIEVEDQGIGIPEEYRNTIFDEFSQVEADSRRSYEGTGLGLAMVKNLVDYMQGTISLRSEVGEGTTFTIKIPYIPEEDLDTTVDTWDQKQVQNDFLSELEAKLVRMKPEVLESYRKNRDERILVIDDNSTNCEVVSGLLESEGYHVETTISARDGLNKMRSSPPDILLLDMMMPEMSGEDVIEEMKRDDDLSGIPVIIITARASVEDRIAGLNLGVDDYLAKPIISAELLSRVENMAERHRMLRAMEKLEFGNKLAQLGGLFAELSHELKNIVNSSNLAGKLEQKEIALALCPFSLPEETITTLANKLSEEDLVVDSNNAVLVPSESSYELSSMLQFLGGLPIPIEQKNLIKDQLICLEHDELRVLENVIQILNRYKSFYIASNRSFELVQAVLFYSKNTEETNCNLFDVWQKLLVLTREKALKAKVDMSASIPKQLLLKINPRECLQVLLNLVLNAIDYVEGLSIADRWVRITADTDEDCVSILIENGGASVTQDIANKMFNYGYTTKSDSGTGFGLFVSRRIAKKHEGDLRYDQKFGHPAFFFDIPFFLGQGNGKQQNVG